MKREVPHFRIGLLLTEAGILDPQQLNAAIMAGEKTGVPFLRVLVSSGFLSQEELQAVVRAQSLIWKGFLEVEPAVKALNLVHTRHLTIEESLKSVGWVRPEVAAAQESHILPVSVQERPDSVVRQRPAEGGNGGQKCQYCAAPLDSGALRCQFCTGEVPKIVPSVSRVETVRNVDIKPFDDRSIKAVNPPRDPVIMSFFSGCCVPGVGQVLMGQTAKGITLVLSAVVLAFLTGGMVNLLLSPLAALDAYLLAEKLKNGKYIGPWECF